jgi:hypothetical protein
MKLRNLRLFSLIALLLALVSGCAEDDDDAPAVAELCGDGTDNDGDGFVDCTDQDCFSDAASGCAGDDDDTAGDDDDSSSGDDDSLGDDDDAGDQDVDGDGYSPGAGDCDDGNPTINAAAAELCDSIDHNCDGDPTAGAVDAATWYEDVDGDGYGVDTNSVTACNQPHGYTSYSGDCDDTAPSYHPGAAEADCSDPEDYNCDGQVGYVDGDGDGVPACEDCDDSNQGANPAAGEACNGFDDDCDGQIDEAGAQGESTWSLDADGDGYGRSSSLVTACAAPLGYVANAGDCDDLDPGAYPGAIEVCDEIDNDCNGQVDEGAAAPAIWYADSDGDGYGNPALFTTACQAPLGYTSDSDDCDDLDASSNPGGAEVCDGADNNCDTFVDEGVTTTFYGDSDGDGYGDPGAPLQACFLPGGASVNADDCDDGEASVHPGGVEICDGLDNDCSNGADVGALDAVTWYTDGDGDGFGVPGTGALACNAPTGAADNADDCDDSDVANYPGNTELCDGGDNDCDLLVDEGFDGDGDGITTCGSDGLAGSGDEDCDDGDPANFPGNSESCDGADEDCDTVIDNGFDGDGDGITSCGPDGVSGTADDDCDDPAGGSAGIGSSALCAATSCAAVYAVLTSPASGLYWIDPQNSGAAYEVYCEMVADGGGWTLVMTASNNSSYTYSHPVWTDTTTTNTAALDPTADTNVVSPAFYDLAGAVTRLCMERYDTSAVVCTTHNHGSSSARDLANGAVLSSSQGTSGLLPASLQTVTAGAAWAAYTFHRYGWQHGSISCGGVRLGFSADDDSSDSRDSGIGVGLDVNGCGSVSNPGGSGYFHHPWPGHPIPNSAGLRSQIWIR